MVSKILGIKMFAFNVLFIKKKIFICISSPTIGDLADFLHNICLFQYSANDLKHISIINTDNVTQNGTKLRELVKRFISNKTDLNNDENFQQWLDSNVTFHNSIVDRITSHRAGDEFVPRTEPLPSKALIIEDLNHRLPEIFQTLTNFGVRICFNEEDLPNYTQLKLLIANATHTCATYSMALSWFSNTSDAIQNSLFIDLINGIFYQDIYQSFQGEQRKRAEETFIEWRRRLQHPFFGLSTFFINQNALIKLRK